MMNDFKKIYTADTLKKNKVVSIVTLPLEESIMVPVSQAIDLMKQGENILFFTFNHDSNKVYDFFQNFLKNEPEPEKITGNLGIVDAFQIPDGADWIGFVEKTIRNVKNDMELNYVFFDVMPYLETHPVRPAGEDLVVSTLLLIAFTEKITPILIKTAKAPVITAVQSVEQAKGSMEELLNIELEKSLKESKMLIESCDMIISINREKQNFWKKLWKKIVNFLLFWRKRNNFTLRVLKNRNGGKKSYRMNLDMDNFTSEVL